MKTNELEKFLSDTLNRLADEEEKKASLVGKVFSLEDVEYEIHVDGRKDAGSIGLGVVMFWYKGKPEPDSGLYSESGCYFWDEPPYFNEKQWKKDRYG